MKTRNARDRGRIGLSFVVGLWAAGCSQPRMAAPADVNQGMDELPVEGRSMASGMLVNEDFKMADKVVHGECTSEVGEKGFSLGSTSVGKQTAKLGCACGAESAPSASVVMAAETGGNGYGGTLKAHADNFQLKAIYDREGAMLSDGTPAGYRVDGHGMVGAVDVLGKGRVWVQKKLAADQRADLACVFAGLLLYKPPRE